MTRFCKIGFHAGVGGNRTGIGDYMKRLDAAAIPFAVKSVGDAGLAVEAAEFARQSGVAHNIIFRIDTPGGAVHDIPDYKLPPQQAAQEHWQRVQQSLAQSPELEPYKSIIWLELFNEARVKWDHDDPNWNNMHPADWLGWFAHHLGQHVVANGWRYAAFGMNAGEPELEDWLQPGMRQFLADCAAHPEKLAISLHEGKIGNMHAHPQTFYPDLIGRFESMFGICDQLGLTRPTVFLSEWAWAHNNMPGPDEALENLKWVAQLMARFDQARAVFLWNLGAGAQWADLPNKLQLLMTPLTTYALQARFPTPTGKISEEVKTRLSAIDFAGPGPGEPPAPPPPAGQRGQPRAQYERTYVLLPPSAGRAWAQAVVEATWEDKRFTIGGSADDAGIGDLDTRNVLAVNPQVWQGDDGQALADFFVTHYPGVTYKSVRVESPAALRALLAQM